MKKSATLLASAAGLLLLVGHGSVAIGGARSAEAGRNLDGGPLACDFSGVKGERISVGIENGDVTGALLSIPREYILSHGVKSGRVYDTLFLSVNKRDFGPFPERLFNSTEARIKRLGGNRDWITILITVYPPLEAMARTSLTGIDYHSTSLAGKEPDLAGKSLGNGLFAQRVRASPHFNDLFLGRDGKQITDVISCAQPGDVPFPQCEHTFEAGPYDVRTSYPLKELPGWKLYRDEITSFIRCLTKKEPTQK